MGVDTVRWFAKQISMLEHFVFYLFGENCTYVMKNKILVNEVKDKSVRYTYKLLRG